MTGRAEKPEGDGMNREGAGWGRSSPEERPRAREERMFPVRRLCFEALMCIDKTLIGKEGPTRQERRAFRAVVRAMRYLSAYEPETARWERSGLRVARIGRTKA